MQSQSRTITRRSAVGATFGLCALAALPATASAAGAAAGTPGGRTIGDPYYPTDGNTGYDVRHYDLRLDYVPNVDRLSGTATILLVPTQDLSRFTFDFGLTASSVLVNNAAARFSGGDGKLDITPAQVLPKGTPVTVVVRYAGVPSAVEIYGEKCWVSGPDCALASQEPHMGAFWYPCNEHPRDKATYDLSVTVPQGLSAISTGILTGRTAAPGNKTRWTWRSTKPQATYLQSLAIGRYEIDRGTAPSGLPYLNAYQDTLGDSLDAAKASVARTPEIVEWASGMFGPYPFEALGGVVTSLQGFSLEHQTRPTYGAGNFARGANTSLVTHELTHQWFGDYVSVHSWRNIWLNEAFATYAQWLWSAYNGEGSAQELMDFAYENYPADDPAWSILPGDPGPDHQFDGLAVYDRAAMSVQALRNTVGDNAFFVILRQWPERHSYRTATIEDFIALAEEVSQRSLRALFRTWLFTEGKPERTVRNGFPPATARTAALTREPKSWAQIKAAHQAAHPH